MIPNEVIVEIAGEGGSVVLYGLRTESGWLFSRDLIDATLVTSENALPDNQSMVAANWTDALELLSRYPWYRLTPLRVHPEFRTEVLAAVTTKAVADEGDENVIHRKWRGLCVAPEPGSAVDLSNYIVSSEVHSSDAFLYDLVGDEPNSDEDRKYLREEMLELVPGGHGG